MIQIQNMSKIYPNNKGVFNVNLEVKKGEVFGFLGPNGAGKTTTIRQLLGFTNATKGTCFINGLDTRQNAAEIQKTLGYLPGEISFFDHMTGYDFLNFIAQMRGLSTTTKRDKLIEYFELECERKIKKMSKGMKQKVGIVAAFMHNPEIIILDEPTSGLDPLMQKRFIQLVNEEKKKGKTILMSSHIFDEIDKTCSRAAIIKDGKIVAIDHIPTMKQNLRKCYRITVKNERDVKKIISSGLEIELIDDLKIQIYVKNQFDLLFSVLNDCQVTSLDAAEQTLEQIFIKYYGKENN